MNNSSNNNPSISTVPTQPPQQQPKEKSMTDTVSEGLGGIMGYFSSKPANGSSEGAAVAVGGRRRSRKGRYSSRRKGVKAKYHGMSRSRGKSRSRSRGKSRSRSRGKSRSRSRR